MQSDPTVVSQHTSPDLSQANASATQHGNHFDGRSVSGPLHQEVSGDSSGLDLPSPGADHSPLSDAEEVPPSSPVNRVSQYENAGTPSRKGADLAFRVVASPGHFNVPVESLPNGMKPPDLPRPRRRATANVCARGSHTNLVAPTSAVPLRHHFGISSVSRPGHHSPCLEDCLLPVLPGSPGYGEWTSSCSG